MNTSPSLTIVIPLYNEEKILAESVRTLVSFLKESHFPYPYTVILANNGSTDGSWRVCEDMARQYDPVRAFNVGKKGKGYAIRTAWTASAADVLVFMDADLSSDLHYLRALVEPLREGRADLVIGNRLGAKSVLISHKKTRKIASRVYNTLTRFFLGTHVDDHQCGFKAMRRDSFLKIAPFLQDEKFFFDTELIALSEHANLAICSVDILWRDSPSSKVSLLKDSLMLLRDMITLRRRLSSLHT